jgi:glycosyltransferase involved in cell wall biosynthesis
MSVSRHSIAVVIPVRDGSSYLPEAIATALAQAPRPDELIVVDDGSVDGSGELAQSLGATVVRQEPTGPGAARNLGATTASSDLVAFLDADDRMVPGRLQVQRDALAADDSLDGAFGLMRLFSDGREPAGPSEPCLLPSALLVRRRVLLDSGGFDAELAAGEFVDWLARCRQAGRRFRLLDTVVAERRVHDGNLTRDRERLRAGYVAVARSAIDRHRSASDSAATDDAR